MINLYLWLKRQKDLGSEAYQDEGGKWTVGYGHTGDDVMEGTTMSQSAATAQLGIDLQYCFKEG